MGAFLCLCFGATPQEAWQPFSGLEDLHLIPYRDATWAKSTFDLEVMDCWAGLLRAVATGREGGREGGPDGRGGCDVA